MRDLVQEIMSTLRHNKLRMALTGFAISWGIFLLIVLLSMATGVTNAFKLQVADTDFNTVRLYGGYTSKAYKGMAENREIALKENDAQTVQTLNSTYIAKAVPERRGNGTVSTGKDYVSAGYTGAFPEIQKAKGLKMIHGRFLNQNDLKERRRVMVVGDKNSGLLFGDKDPVGKTVMMNNLSFTIVGVYSHDWNREFYIPYSTAAMMAGGSDTIESVTGDLRNVYTEADGRAAEEAIRQSMARTHGFDPEDEGAVWVRNSFLDMLRMQTATNSLELAVWIIGFLTLLSGIVGVSNIMFVSVRERTHEIGVRRALGARPWAILKQIMLESVAITTLFGYVGIVMGVGLSALIGTFLGQSAWLSNPTIPLSVCVEVTIVLIFAGCLSGLFPALKALKVKPVEALRDE